MGSRSGSSIGMDVATDIASGGISSVRRVFQAGMRTVAAAITSVSNAEDVWPGAANTYPLMTAATQLEVVSSSALDTAAGSGMQTVTINCLDTAWGELASQTVSLNGTTPVVISGVDKYRINSAVGGMSASNPNVRQRNAGTITIRDVGGGTTRAVIMPNAGTLQQCVYTVPVGYSLFLFSLEAQILFSAGGGGSSKGADVALEFHGPSGYSTQARYLSCTDVTPYQLKADTRIRVNEKTDFIIRCIYTSVNNVTVGSAWEGHLRRN